MPTILTTLRLPDAAVTLLRDVGQLAGPADWEMKLGDATALITLLTVRVDEELLDRAPRLRVVANAAVGYDNIDVAACRRRGITVTNTPDVLTDATADLTLALLLSAVRRLPQAENSLRRGEFQGWRFYDYLAGDITGATLGIFGMGRTGRAVAHRAAAFGMRLQYNSRTRLEAAEEAERSLTWVDWETLLTTSDILTLHAPYTAETHHILDHPALARMKPGSFLINTARGALIDEAALVHALQNGPLAGAGLDVYEHEPVLHPGLLALENITLLPHIGSATPRTRAAMATLAGRNVHAVLSGGAPLTPVPS